jgi:hypothetical protein
MSIVSIAIVVSFHLKNQPSDLELRMALPLGLVFWSLSLSCLALGFGNYIKTVTKFSRRAALVQTGWKTQVVSLRIVRSFNQRCLQILMRGILTESFKLFTTIAISIIAVCVLFLSTNAKRS